LPALFFKKLKKSDFGDLGRNMAKVIKACFCCQISLHPNVYEGEIIELCDEETDEVLEFCEYCPVIDAKEDEPLVRRQKCSKCCMIKSAGEFAQRPERLFGLAKYCRECSFKPPEKKARYHPRTAKMCAEKFLLRKIQSVNKKNEK
jgi:hypothetical protein